MPSIRVRDGESIDSAIRRFKRTWEKSGGPRDIRKRESYEKPSAVRKRKAAAAKKRFAKKCARENAIFSQGKDRDRRSK